MWIRLEDQRRLSRNSFYEFQFRFWCFWLVLDFMSVRFLIQRAAGSQKLSCPPQSSSDEPPSLLLQELQEVKSEAAAATEQLQKYQQTCSRLQQDLRVRDLPSIHQFL